MRIERLHLERYGMFTDRSFSFRPEATLHVVLGPNEGGKTSALWAMGNLLFGFDPRTDYDFRHEGKSLRVGGAFRHSDGRLIAARRRKGIKNTLIGDDDRVLPYDTLAPLLGGLSRDAFSREFGLTAEALRDGGEDLLNAGGRLAETLAASSAGMSALSRIREKLQSEADDLFTSRKSAGKPFYQAADRRDNADKALRGAIVTRETLRDLETAVQEAHANLDALNAEHGRSGGILSGWRGRYAYAQSWRGSKASRQNLLPSPIFPRSRCRLWSHGAPRSIPMPHWCITSQPSTPRTPSRQPRLPQRRSMTVCLRKLSRSTVCASGSARCARQSTTCHAVVSRAMTLNACSMMPRAD